MDTEDLGARLVPALRVITLWIAGLLVLRWVLQRNGNFLFLLLLAWLLAIAMDPGIRWFASRGLKRGMATGAVMLSLIVLSAAFLAAFGGVLFSQAASLIQVVPDVDALNNARIQLDAPLSIRPAEALLPEDLAVPRHRHGQGRHPLLHDLRADLVAHRAEHRHAVAC